jgi:hypothetical protein
LLIPRQIKKAETQAILDLIQSREDQHL